MSSNVDPAALQLVDTVPIDITALLVRMDQEADA